MEYYVWASNEKDDEDGRQAEGGTSVWVRRVYFLGNALPPGLWAGWRIEL